MVIKNVNVSHKKIDPKIYIVGIVVSLIMLVVFGTYSVLDYVKTKDYVKVPAVITYVGYYYSNGGDSDNKTLVNYIEVNYTYNDKSYTSTQRVFFRGLHKKNNKVTLYVNPEEPSIARNNYFTKCSHILFVLSLIFNIVTIKAYITRGKHST